MPQGVEVIATGRLMTERGEPILLRDDGGRWGLFLECRSDGLLGRRVTIRGTRFGFGMLHVTGIAPGSQAPPEARSFSDWLVSPPAAVELGVSALLVWYLVRPVWHFAATLLG